MALREEFRTVIVRNRSGKWWQRYQWAVESRHWHKDDWRLKNSGYALTAKRAMDIASEEALPTSAKLARIEVAVHIQHAPYETKEPVATPLPPQLLDQETTDA